MTPNHDAASTARCRRSRQGVSVYEATVFLAFLQEPERWWTHPVLDDALIGIAPRTVRHHAQRLAEKGLIERVWVFPEYRYRLVVSPATEALAHGRQILDALRIVRATGGLPCRVKVPAGAPPRSTLDSAWASLAREYQEIWDSAAGTEREGSEGARHA